ncbi:MAG: 4-alpha-glucanotransferase [Cyclobacteriaceae bacterium]
MKLTFQIDYRTRWGQEVKVCGSTHELGNWDITKALSLYPTAGEHWEASIELEDSMELEYKFLIIDQGEVTWEFGDSRKLKPVKGLSAYYIKDNWRSQHDVASNLSTSPFLKAFFNRVPSKPRVLKAVNGKSYVKLQIRTPRIGKDYSLGVIGSSAQLSNWDQTKPMLMSDVDFPVWQVDIPLTQEDLPFEYKYVIYSHKEEKVVTWENGNNRYLPIHEIQPNQMTIWTDEAFRYPVGDWKAAGVAIPVFSLRSDKGTGVGEFTDINLLVDWAVKTGMKLVQILPVNDTVATHTWVDSYPYAAISVHALHPIYANLQTIGDLKNKSQQQKINKERKRLNALAELDYEAVMNLKSQFFKASYSENKAALKTPEFKTFFKENKHWLLPYAAFSALRDKHGTVDFSKWGKHAVFNEKTIEKLASPRSKDYDDIAVHFYIQYHLDQQLKAASEYARGHGVVLKGDIPIGIYRNSVDAWVAPHLYNMDSQAGAPPDDFSVSGQNWGFPTYDWDEMAKDNYAWWKDRLVKMSEYFDVFRIDHILGFFRIWEIPNQYVEGIMGHFNPSLPVTIQEMNDRGLWFDYHRMCQPYIKAHVVKRYFSNHADHIFETYLQADGADSFSFKEEFNSQKKIKEYFDLLNKDHDANIPFNNWIRDHLYNLHTEVIFIPDQQQQDAFNPRIAFHSTSSFQDLDESTRQKLDDLYNHYFYHRHNEFWRDSALKKLPAIKEATNMLICGEDLGMVPACVPGVMCELSLLSLAIQRMPNDDREFWHPADTPYMSVTSTGSHDMSSLREWWQEDTGRTQRFYNSIIGYGDDAPYYCEPWVARDVVNQHLQSPSMWAIFPIQDLVAMDGQLRRDWPEDERINIPAIAQHYWKYRFHISIEDLLENDGFSGFVRQLVDQGGRSADY